MNVNYKIILKKSFLVFIFIFLLSTPYFIGLVVSSSQVTQSSSNIEYSMRSVLLSEDYAYLSNSIRFLGLYSFEKDWCWSETTGMMCSSNIIEPYHENPLLILLSFYPIILVLICILITLQKSKTHKKIAIISLLGLSLIFLFFAKMVNTPFGNINEFLFYNFSPFLILFRSAWKYMQIPYILIIALLICFCLNEIRFNFFKDKRKFLALMTVLFFIHMAYAGPALAPPNQLINEKWITSIPEEYYDISKFINDQGEEFRILPLPISKHFTGYTPYKWGYAGPDVLYSLIEKPILDKFHNPVLTENQINFVNNIENLSHTNLNELLTFAKNSNVKYILLRKDVDLNHPYIKVWGNPDLIELSLEQNKNIKKKYNFGNLTLYEIEYLPKISVISDIHRIECRDSYLDIDDENQIIFQFEKIYDKIKSFSLNVSLILNNKNDVNESDWKDFNHCILKTDFFKVSISPKGFVYIYLYNKTNSFKSFILDVNSSHLMNKEINLDFYFSNDMFYIVKDGFIESYPYSDKIYSKVTTLNIGGEPDLEKMNGFLYNISFSINEETILDFNDIVSLYPYMIVYDTDENKNFNIDDIFGTKSLSFLKDSEIYYKSVSFEKIDPTRYSVKVNSNSSFLLGFSTSFDENWEATVYKNGTIIETCRSSSLFSSFNGFQINSTGDLDIEITYFPQNWFKIGLIISISTFFLGIVIYFFSTNRLHLPEIRITLKKYRRKQKIKKEEYDSEFNH